MSEPFSPSLEVARFQDFDAIATLLRGAELAPDGLEEHLDTTVVARMDGRIVGCAALELYSDGALLRSVAIAGTLRGTGLGRKLTLAALDLARRHGVDRVYLLTETAASYFPRFGFQNIARSAVAPGVKQSAEFTTLCPESAQAMVLDLRRERESQSGSWSVGD